MKRLKFYGPIVVIILWIAGLCWLLAEHARIDERKYEVGRLDFEYRDKALWIDFTQPEWEILTMGEMRMKYGVAPQRFRLIHSYDMWDENLEAVIRNIR